MNPSPFDHNLNAQQKINRITVTVSGPAGSGKSALGAFILAAFRAQGFQVGVTDANPDNPAPTTRLAQNSIIAIEVKEPANLVHALEDLKRTNAELETKLVKANQDNLALQEQLDDASKQLGPSVTQALPPEITGYQVSVEAPKPAVALDIQVKPE